MIIFAYDFPHRKTEDFILHCFLNDIKIDAIIATGWRKLKINSVPFKTKVAIAPKYEPEELAFKFNIPYSIVFKFLYKVQNFIIFNVSSISFLIDSNLLKSLFLNNP